MSGTNALLRLDAPMPGQAPNQLAPPPTWADAATNTAQNVGDYIAQQRALPPQSPAEIGGIMANALLMGTTAPGIRAFHGSPHDFNAFDASKIGIGQGEQAYGHGLYFADSEAVAKSYRDSLSRTDYTTSTGARIPDWIGSSIKQVADQFGADSKLHGQIIDRHIGDFEARLADEQSRMKTAPDPWNSEDRIANFNNILTGLKELKAGDATLQPRGRMYEVNIGSDPAHFLDWDKPLSEQSPAVRDRLQMLLQAHQVPRANNAGGETTGSQLYNHLYDKFGGDAAAVAQELHGEGIPGIRYLDAGSRAQGGTSNTVVFDPATIEILRKYGIAGLIGGGAAAGVATQGEQ